MLFEPTNGSPKQKSTEKSERTLLSSAFSHQCFNCLGSTQEALVVAHRHKAVEAAGGVKRHTNNDQQAGTTQLDAHTGQVAQNDRQYSHRSQEDRAQEGDLVQGAGDEIAGRLAGTEAGDRAVVAAQIVGDLNGVVLDGHIEVVKGQDQQQVDDDVQRRRVVKGMEKCIPERMRCLVNLQKAADRARDRNQSGSEDDRHDTAHVQLQRQVAVLPAHLLAAHHALGVLDGDTALSVRHNDDEHDHDQCQNDQQGQQNVELGLTSGGAGQQTGNRRVQGRPVGNDRREDQEGQAIANALVIDLLAAPGDQLSTRGERCNDDHAFTHLIYIFGYLWTKVTIFAFMKTYTSNHIVFFSPTHTSAKIARAIGESIGMGRRIEIDLTTDENSSPIEIKDSITIIAVPVYAGRVAPIALQRLRRLKGNNAPAILVAVYGNRDYEDALVELRDETIQLGFTPLAAGAFIGEHSYSRPNMPIAEGRPDVTDLQIAEQFGKDCLTKLEKDETLSDFYLKGNIPYRFVGPSTPAAPVCTEECFACGECIEVCPTHAIALSDEGKIETEITKCIKCCACVKECPNGARVFDTPYTPMLHQKCAARREPELFI